MEPSIIIQIILPIVILEILLFIHIKQSNIKNGFLNGFIIKPISSIIGYPYFKKNFIIIYFFLSILKFFIGKLIITFLGIKFMGRENCKSIINIFKGVNTNENKN